MRLQNVQCPTFEKLTSEHLGLVGLLLYTKEKLNGEEPESKLNEEAIMLIDFH